MFLCLLYSFLFQWGQVFGRRPPPKATVFFKIPFKTLLICISGVGSTWAGSAASVKLAGQPSVPQRHAHSRRAHRCAAACARAAFAVAVPACPRKWLYMFGLAAMPREAQAQRALTICCGPPPVSAQPGPFAFGWCIISTHPGSKCH